MANARTTQKQLIRAYLEAGKTITPMVAFQEYGCLNLSARIAELKYDGMAIRKNWYSTPSGKRVMSYFL